MTATLIEATGVSAGYGKMPVIRDVDLHVDEGDVVALIGANGAGKTTTLLTLAGELTPMAGEVQFRGQPTKAPMHARCRNGLGYVTEERSVIMDMSVADNLKLANVAPSVAFEYFPALERAVHRRAGLCSGGEQQMLALARILRTGATLLVLDEISEGLAPVIVDKLADTVMELRKRNYTTLMVEQNFGFAMDLADRMYLVEHGKVVDHLAREEVSTSQARVEALLGI